MTTDQSSVGTTEMRMTIGPGDHVRKKEGYDFRGTVVSAFLKLDNETARIVVEHHDSGMLHIFRPEQLEHVVTHDCYQYQDNTDMVWLACTCGWEIQLGDCVEPPIDKLMTIQEDHREGRL